MKHLISALVALCLSACQAFAGEPSKPRDMNAILKEVMKLAIESKQQALAIWTPYEFYLAAGQMENPQLTDAEGEKELGLLRNYVVLAVQVAVDDDEGRKVGFPESSLRAMARLRFADGKTVRPLTPQELSPKLAATLGAVRGAMQQGSAQAMEILVFPNKTPEGTPILRATQPGRVTLELENSGLFRATSFTWRTPLDALVEARACTKCQEPTSAAWAFCPYCGQSVTRK